jgi:inner membrane protein
VDNLTHSLLGGVLAELALPPAAERATRRVFFALGVVAANLPDVDILYTRITPPPLGYLLHHRGHTHTILGLVVQGLLLAAIVLLVPAVRRLAPPIRRRLALLGAVALSSHLLLDSWNSYGVHPFHPFDSRWYYGDAVFIFEPWLWALLGVSLVANATWRWSRVLLIGLVGLVPLAFTILGVLSSHSFSLLAAGVCAFGWLCRRLSRVERSVAALGACAVFVAHLFVLAAFVRAQARDLLRPEIRGQAVDVIVTPQPADSLCWMVIVVEEDPANGIFSLHRGTLSLMPFGRPAQGCAFQRLWNLPSVPWPSERRLARGEPIRVPIGRLREYASRDCRVRAWMQFGRAPFFEDDEIRDLRFETGPRENFTAMTIREGGACPSYLTSWGLPRADLLE